MGWGFEDRTKECFGLEEWGRDDGEGVMVFFKTFWRAVWDEGAVRY